MIIKSVHILYTYMFEANYLKSIKFKVIVKNSAISYKYGE